MKKSALLFILGFVVTCGNSTKLSIDVDLAVNQDGNPMLEIEQLRDAGASRGVFFTFESLQCPPPSMDALSSTDRLEWPPHDGDGYSPTKGEYKLNTNDLLPRTYYRVTMQALMLDGTVTHQGVSDCPINISNPNATKATICFGDFDLSSTPLCPDTFSFRDCQVDNSFCL